MSLEALEWLNQNYSVNKANLGYYKPFSKVNPKYVAILFSKHAHIMEILVTIGELIKHYLVPKIKGYMFRLSG